MMIGGRKSKRQQGIGCKTPPTLTKKRIGRTKQTTTYESDDSVSVGKLFPKCCLGKACKSPKKLIDPEFKCDNCEKIVHSITCTVTIVDMNDRPKRTFCYNCYNIKENSSSITDTARLISNLKNDDVVSKANSDSSSLYDSDGRIIEDSNSTTIPENKSNIVSIVSPNSDEETLRSDYDPHIDEETYDRIYANDFYGAREPSTNEQQAVDWFKIPGTNPKQIEQINFIASPFQISASPTDEMEDMEYHKPIVNEGMYLTMPDLDIFQIMNDSNNGFYLHKDKSEHNEKNTFFMFSIERDGVERSDWKNWKFPMSSVHVKQSTCDNVSKRIVIFETIIMT